MDNSKYVDFCVNCESNTEHGVWEGDKGYIDRENGLGDIRLEFDDVEGSIIFKINKCSRCGSYKVYKSGDLIYPIVGSAGVDEPYRSMGKDVVDIYKESSKILDISPRASLMMSRLALETYVKGKLKGKDKEQDLYNMINTFTKNMENKGKFLKKDLHAMRLIGNAFVHNYEKEMLGVDESKNLARSTLKMINFVAYELDEVPFQTKSISEELQVYIEELKNKNIIKKH